MAVLHTTMSPSRLQSLNTATTAPKTQDRLITALNPARSTVSYMTIFTYLQVFQLSKLFTLNILFTITALFKAVLQVFARLWKSIEPLRRKLFFEFMVFILNPYALSLFIFWPGWPLLGGGYLVWKFMG